MASEGKRMAIFGKAGSGKSHYAKTMVESMSRVVVFDPEEEFGDLPGFIQVETIEALKDVLADCWDSSFKVAYVPAPMREEAELHNVSLLVEMIGEAFRKGHISQRMTLMVDELHSSFPISPKPEYVGFARVVSKGRKRGINVIGITQRPAEVASRFRGNLDRVACFNLSFVNDFSAVEKAMGISGLQGRLDALPRYGFVYRDEDGTIHNRTPV